MRLLLIAALIILLFHVPMPLGVK
uniref:Uncharacterized protein n=1 Tax=Arundo donax TaxID=35708 RepID=A0A0A8YGY9_ARUDO